MRRCPNCGQERSLEFFRCDKRKKNGYWGNCKTCRQIDHAAQPDVPPVMEGEWECWDCKKTKHVTLFPRNKKSATGRHGLCKACHNRRAKAYRADNYSNARAIELRTRFKTLYGMTPDDYEALLELQGGGCAICGKTPEQDGKRLSVDHDHACCPGKKSCGECLRGLLCTHCNQGLGHFFDDQERLLKANAYLRRGRSSLPESFQRTQGD